MRPDTLVAAIVGLLLLAGAGWVGHEIADSRWQGREAQRLELERQRDVQAFDLALKRRQHQDLKNEEIERAYQQQIGSAGERLADAHRTVERLRAALSAARAQAPADPASAGQPHAGPRDTQDGPGAGGGDRIDPQPGAVDRALAEHLAACRVVTAQALGLQQYVTDVCLAPLPAEQAAPP